MILSEVAEKAEFKRVRLSEKVWLGWLKIDVGFVFETRHMEVEQKMLWRRDVRYRKMKSVVA